MTVSTHALICDCDGVLIDSEAIAARMLVHELESRWPDADVAPVVMPLLGMRTEHVLDATAAQLERTLSAADIEAIRDAVSVGAMEAPLVEGIVAALGQVPLRKACASNSNTAYVQAVLARTGLVEFFGDRVFCADSVALPKPAPDVYLAAARGLNLTPHACLVVEDSVTGVRAASAAGMTVIGFIGGGHANEAQIEALRAAGAVHVFDDMRQLPVFVTQWMERVAIGSH
ncbi:MAG: HAD family phosphatase [Paraburkholderia sp.]|uniref:HAD family hydrolase n=1 Tax=Paraburkholderia sp. TaxID=1926495 RepID=UPI001207DEC6|nr:HAD family phosphatase [Paraburkholderia sp.]TAL92056.1 MAG: HAD family phosphatase [Paraburkholderia sp.]